MLNPIWVPDVSKIAMMNRRMLAGYLPLNGNVTLHYYATGITLGSATILSDFTEISLPGYTPVVLTGVVNVGVNHWNNDLWIFPTQYTIASSSPGSPVTAYGYYVTANDNGDLLWCAAFETPFTWSAEGDTLEFKPSLFGGELMPSTAPPPSVSGDAGIAAIAAVLVSNLYGGTAQIGAAAVAMIGPEYATVAGGIVAAAGVAASSLAAGAAGVAAAAAATITSQVASGDVDVAAAASEIASSLASGAGDVAATSAQVASSLASGSGDVAGSAVVLVATNNAAAEGGIAAAAAVLANSLALEYAEIQAQATVFANSLALGYAGGAAEVVVTNNSAALGYGSVAAVATELASSVTSGTSGVAVSATESASSLAEGAAGVAAAATAAVETNSATGAGSVAAAATELASSLATGVGSSAAIATELASSKASGSGGVGASASVAASSSVTGSAGIAGEGIASTGSTTTGEGYVKVYSVVPNRTGGLVNPADPVNWDHPLNVGRVAWWKVVRNPGFRGGSVWHDLVRGGRSPNDASLIGTLGTNYTWSGVWNSGSLIFDGVSGYGNGGSCRALYSGGNCTFIAWFNNTSIVSSTNRYEGILTYGQSANVIYSLSLTPVAGQNNNLLFEVQNSSGSYQDSPGYTITPNTWYMAAGVIKGGTIGLYLFGPGAGGLLQGSTNSFTGVPQNGGATFSIGIGRDWYDSQTGRFFKGYISEASIYTRALSLQELTSLSVLSRQSSRQNYPDVLNYLR